MDRGDKFRPVSSWVSEAVFVHQGLLLQESKSGLWMGPDGWAEFGQAVDGEGPRHSPDEEMSILGCPFAF